MRYRHEGVLRRYEEPPGITVEIRWCPSYEISEKKWAEAHHWAGGRVTSRKYGCRISSGQTKWWRVVPRGSSRGSTS